ncbi:hypothetical protein BHE74_00049779, partial [Ensete ventricosum]
AAIVAHATVLCFVGGHLCPRPGATTLERQPLRASGAALRSNLVCRPAHGPVPASDRHCGWVPRCRRSPLRALRCRWLPLQGALATTDRLLIGGQAVADRPYRVLDRG